MLVLPSSSVYVVRVWDLPVRLYHWLQAALVALLLGSGFLAPEWWLGWHQWLGYGLGGLLVFRLIWGLLGSQYSRFSSFIFPLAKLRDHLRGLIRGRPPYAIGHNPLGALMVFALIATLLGMGISGLIALGGVENQGPLAGLAGYAVGAQASEIHSTLAVVLMLMITAHIIGTLLESRLSRESLIRAMITGDKRLPAGIPAPNLRPARRRAALIATLLVSAVLLSAGSIASRIPASGLITLPRQNTYQGECAECHELYHPSLLPRASWSALMAGLENHFGEDAGLDPETSRAIAAYLAKYASESWDTEAANLLRVVADAAPTRITAAPFWKYKHQNIDEAVFAAQPVRGRGHCAACHRDAASGRFDDQMIALPSL